MTAAPFSLSIRLRAALRRAGDRVRRHALAALFVLLGAAALWWPTWLELLGFLPADPLWRAYHVDGDVGALAWSPDGSKLAVSTTFQLAVGVLNLESGKMLWKMREHVSGLHSIAFTPDGKYVVTPTAPDRQATGAALDIRDAETGRLAREVPGIHPHEDYGSNVGRTFAFSPDGKLLVVTSDPEPGKPAAVYSTETWQELRRLSYDNSIFGDVAIGGNGGVAFDGAGGEIIIFYLASGALERVIKAYDLEILTHIAYSPDGRLLVSGAFPPNERRREPDPLRIWRVADGAKTRSLVLNSPWGIDAIAWSPDGQDIAWASEDGAIYLWRLRSSDQPTKLIELSSPSLAIAFGPDGRHLAIGGRRQVLVQKLDTKG